MKRVRFHRWPVFVRFSLFLVRSEQTNRNVLKGPSGLRSNGYQQPCLPDGRVRETAARRVTATRWLTVSLFPGEAISHSYSPPFEGWQGKSGVLGRPGVGADKRQSCWDTNFPFLFDLFDVAPHSGASSGIQETAHGKWKGYPWLIFILQFQLIACAG